MSTVAEWDAVTVAWHRGYRIVKRPGGHYWAMKGDPPEQRGSAYYWSVEEAIENLDYRLRDWSHD